MSAPILKASWSDAEKVSKSVTLHGYQSSKLLDSSISHSTYSPKLYKHIYQNFDLTPLIKQLALLVSMIKSNGAPKWNNGIAVPKGRTLQASAKMYSEIIKSTASVEMTEGDAVTPSGKRARFGASETANLNPFTAADNGNETNPTKKRKAATTSKAKTSKVKTSKAKKTEKGGKPNMAEAIRGDEDATEEDFEASEVRYFFLLFSLFRFGIGHVTGWSLSFCDMDSTLAVDIVSFLANTETFDGC